MKIHALLLLLNGIYDVLCSISILTDSLPVLNTLHTGVFREEIAPEAKRLLSYWILTYGVTRILAGVFSERAIAVTAAMTYFIEIFAFEYELHAFESVIQSKVRAMTLMSIVAITAALR